jgi:hypothetical protein
MYFELASGSNFMCFERSGVEGAFTYKPIAGQTNTTLNIEPEDTEVKNKSAGKWKGTLPALMGWNATVDIDMAEPSVTNDDEILWFDLTSRVINRTLATYVFAFVTPAEDSSGTPTIDLTKPYWEGQARINFPVGGNHGENMTSSITIAGHLELTQTDPT